MKVYYAKNIDPNEYNYNNTKVLILVKNVIVIMKSVDAKINISDKTLNKTIEEYRLQLHQLMNMQPPTLNVQPPISNENATFSSTKNFSSNNMFKELIFGSTQRLQEFTDELDFYLDLRWTPVAFPDIDPLLW
ncbi:21635_t:CDS:2 [Gigaspora margarita]|uniref:21635_t:CDS:1 n=1 Tax=Gigaspora margarita TaxID=4874 RepID=A0ABN7VKA4_GIGMA|nr:21635_t:CDS:2 [Gigaspora margarita]